MNTYNRRALSRQGTPPPMPVADIIIQMCRLRTESQMKRRARSALLMLVGRRFGASELGEGFQWGKPVNIRHARVGRYVYVAGGSRLSGPVSIGDLTMISTNVVIVGDDHVFSDPKLPMRLNFPTTLRPPTVIEADCWIGHGAILREGIRLRRGTVIAAGAVVTRDTEPYSVMAGVPARAIRARFSVADQRRHDLLLYEAEF